MLSLLSTLFTFLLITTAVLGAPAPAPKVTLQRRSFEIPRVRRANYVPHGPSALRKAYGKFNITASQLGFDALDFKATKHHNNNNNGNSNKANSSTAAAAAGTENGSVAAVATTGDTEFVAAITVGGQKMTMDFDTGSSDLWVFSTSLPAQDQTGHTIFDPTKSKTFQTLKGASFSITYGDGSGAAGTVGTDTVDIGGATVQNQAVELASQVTGSFIQDTNSNGLVGLAFSKLNTVQPQQQKTFFDNIASQLEEPVMTASLKSDSSAGSYQFGTIDTAKFTGNLANVSINSANGFWEFNSAAFSVGDNGTMQAITTSPTAIADTGTTLMLVSPEVATAYYQQVQGAQLSQQAGGFVFPCNAALPTLSIAVGDNNMATVPASVINFSKVSSTMCFGGIQSNSGSQFQIFGDVFLKSMFVVFDQRGPSLGLASPA